MPNSEPLTRVLYIEDEADIRSVAQIALENIGGLNTLCCASGPEGLAAIVNFAPQLILLDVMMPGMDGPSVLEEIRRQHPLIPVVFITAKVQPAEVDQLMALGAIAVITKPFQAITLAEQLKELWGHYLDG